MTNFIGVIIEESLECRDVLKKVKILSTKVELVTKEHETPWLSQWTLYTVEISDKEAKVIAEEISKSFERNSGGSWYADFKNNTHHYIIFRDKIFFIDRKNIEQYSEAKRYGISLGIPERQLI